MIISLTFVCLSVYVSVCLSVQAITTESLKWGTSFSVCRYILAISRSGLNINVIGSRSNEKILLIVNVFVIYVLRRWYTYYWKAFLLFLSEILLFYSWSQLGQDRKIIHQIDALEKHLQFRPKLPQNVHILSNLTGKVLCFSELLHVL